MNFDIIIGIATLMVCIHNFTFYKTFLETMNIDFKPFNCVLCSTFWVTLVGTIFHFGGIDAIFMASTAAILAEILDIQIHKL
tara:strand:- start:392 stop:637 length:246 start_codon:yes stop_codon:yes gene_type:complete